MARKPTSKRPSVAGHKVKVSNEPAVAAPASPAEAGGPAGSSFGGAAAEAPAAASATVPAAKPGASQAPAAKASAPGAGFAGAAPQPAKAPVKGGTSAAAAQQPKPHASAESGASAKPSVPKNRIAQVKEASSIQHEEVSGKTGTPRMSKKAGKRRVSRKAVAIVSAVLVALAVATSLLAWNQWFRYDDAADIQGTWRVEGSTATFTITDSQIQLTEEVSYPYTLDAFAKTISFSFGNYEGGGSYVFSPERDVLTITETAPDADGGTAATTLVKQ